MGRCAFSPTANSSVSGRVAVFTQLGELHVCLGLAVGAGMPFNAQLGNVGLGGQIILHHLEHGIVFREKVGLARREENSFRKDGIGTWLGRLLLQSSDARQICSRRQNCIQAPPE